MTTKARAIRGVSSIISEAAQSVGISPNLIVRSDGGRSYDDRVNAARAITAAVMHASDTWSLPDIARVLGFSSHSAIIDLKAKLSAGVYDPLIDHPEGREALLDEIRARSAA